MNIQELINELNKIQDKSKQLWLGDSEYVGLVKESEDSVDLCWWNVMNRESFLNNLEVIVDQWYHDNEVKEIPREQLDRLIVKLYIQLQYGLEKGNWL